jgi:hypothetical protein
MRKVRRALAIPRWVQKRMKRADRILVRRGAKTLSGRARREGAPQRPRDSSIMRILTSAAGLSAGDPWLCVSGLAAG